MAKTARGAAGSARSSTKRRGARTSKPSSGDPGEAPAAADDGGSESLDFEAALARLEETVGALEEGELPLERALELFETGVSLSQRCLATLDAAEKRIEILVARSGLGESEDAEALDAEPFDEDVDDEDFED